MHGLSSEVSESSKQSTYRYGHSHPFRMSAGRYPKPTKVANALKQPKAEVQLDVAIISWQRVELLETNSRTDETFQIATFYARQSSDLASQVGHTVARRWPKMCLRLEAAKVRRDLCRVTLEVSETINLMIQYSCPKEPSRRTIQRRFKEFCDAFLTPS